MTSEEANELINPFSLFLFTSYYTINVLCLTIKSITTKVIINKFPDFT